MLDRLEEWDVVVVDTRRRRRIRYNWFGRDDRRRDRDINGGCWRNSEMNGPIQCLKLVRDAQPPVPSHLIVSLTLYQRPKHIVGTRIKRNVQGGSASEALASTLLVVVHETILTLKVTWVHPYS